MRDLPFALPAFLPGWVWLVGAGPGDPGLLTIHALHALRHADAVIYDALVADGVIALARPEATLEYAGKRGGKPSPRQPDITRRLIHLARQGKRVLRLKGGDPFVFGRGGEEGLALVEAGVPFRVVPGITAGIGGPAYAGIPVTHRDVNHAVTLITGHDATGGMADSFDWAALARGSPVLVIYMAIKHLPAITERLLKAGRPADQPVAIVSRATLPEQIVLETTLGRAAADAAASGIPAPAIVVIGETVRLRASLDWLGALGGRTLTVDPLGTRGARSEAG